MCNFEEMKKCVLVLSVLLCTLVQGQMVRHNFVGNGPEVRLYEVIGGKHSRGLNDLDVTEEMWSFFKQYLK